MNTSGLLQKKRENRTKGHKAGTIVKRKKNRGNDAGKKEEKVDGGRKKEKKKGWREERRGIKLEKTTCRKFDR